MRAIRTTLILAAVMAISCLSSRTSSGADTRLKISNFSKPAAGALEILFHGNGGPFLIQKRATLDPTSPWVDIPDATVTQLQPGVYLGMIPTQQDPLDLGFYQILNESEGLAEVAGWTVLLRVSSPANGQFFVQGEAPTVTATILDTMAQGLAPADFSSLNLYMYGPQDPKQTVTALKLLKANGDRAVRPHHYIDLKASPGVQANKNVLTYQLAGVTDEAPGTYTVSLWAVRASDGTQQLMKFANVQIGTEKVEQPVVVKEDAAHPTVGCANCHEGPISGKVYMHHIDPGFSPTGNWSLDYQPVTSCKSCHNNDGYAAIKDSTGAFLSDPIVRRVHGVHMGADLKLEFNTNHVTGDFRDYRHVEFPAGIKQCVICHTDDRWKQQPSRMACGACHDNIWFGPKPAPAGYEAHRGGPKDKDNTCATCHYPDKDPNAPIDSIAENHLPPVPPIDAIDVSLTPPANGKFYVAGEAPVVTLVFKDDAGNPIDHTKVTDGNFSTASLFVYGPRARAVPVLTSAAKNVNSKLRASVTSAKGGPWNINGKIFKIAVNGNAPSEITIAGATDQVTPSEVVTALNSVIIPLGAKASVSSVTNVNIRTTIQGAQARFEIYNGDVTTAMGWKRAPNTIMEPDVTIAASTLPSNDLRQLSDPLDYADPMVTRNAANIIYQLDDVAGLVPGTYNIYVYQLPKTGKIPGIANPTGIGHLTFQVGIATAEKKVATNCTDCHSNTIWHLYEGPIHAEPFDTDWCNACHDYGHVAPGDMFKNQGGTSLAGWSGFGAMPIVRRVHGVHRGNYLDHPEEIYANATVDTFGHIIFPQDIRNCTKCHAESDSWKQKPSRMACLACHDSDPAKAHGALMTFMPNPGDPYGPSSVEMCGICHGADSAFSADKVHSIANPYIPPYPREPRE